MKDTSPRAFRGQLVKSLLECDFLVVVDIETQTSPASVAAVSQPSSTGWDDKVFELLLKRIPTCGQQRLLNSSLHIAFCRESRLLGTLRFCYRLLMLRAGADAVSVANGSDTLLHRICAEHRDHMRKLIGGLTKKCRCTTLLKWVSGTLFTTPRTQSRNPSERRERIDATPTLLLSARSHSQSDVQDDVDSANYCGVRGHE